jgi:hypothetical protein
MKSSNHPVSLHRLTSISSSTTSFPWLTSTLQSNSVNGVAEPNVFEITPRHGPCTENTCQVFAIPPVHWRADWTYRKHITWPILTVAVTSLHLCGSVFTEPLPRNGLHNPVVLLLPVGPCLRSRCLAMRWSLQYDVNMNISVKGNCEINSKTMDENMFPLWRIQSYGI